MPTTVPSTRDQEVHFLLSALTSDQIRSLPRPIGGESWIHAARAFLPKPVSLREQKQKMLARDVEALKARMTPEQIARCNRKHRLGTEWVKMANALLRTKRPSKPASKPAMRTVLVTKYVALPFMSEAENRESILSCAQVSAQCVQGFRHISLRAARKEFEQQRDQEFADFVQEQAGWGDTLEITGVRSDDENDDHEWLDNGVRVTSSPWCWSS